MTTETTVLPVLFESWSRSFRYPLLQTYFKGIIKLQKLSSFRGLIFSMGLKIFDPISVLLSKFSIDFFAICAFFPWNNILASYLNLRNLQAFFCSNWLNTRHEFILSCVFFCIYFRICGVAPEIVISYKPKVIVLNIFLNSWINILGDREV